MYNGEITSRMLCAGYTEGKVDACQVRCMFLTPPRRGAARVALSAVIFASNNIVAMGAAGASVQVFVSTSPGGQWGSSGLPG